jgi:hypothetical protein
MRKSRSSYQNVALFTSCRDDQCSLPWPVSGGTQVWWYPGLTAVDESFKNDVGSYMCQKTTVLEGCPGLGGTNFTTSTSVASAVTSQFSTSASVSPAATS